MPETFTFKQILDAVSAVRMLRFQEDLNERQRWLLYCVANCARSHGQFFQDLWVLHQTGEQRDGFFVEFGAADGLRYSNTLLLEQEYGWRGILAEPGRSWHAALRANRPGATVDDRCVWSRSGESVEFVEQINGLHSAISGYSVVDPDAATSRTYTVPTVSLNDLLAQNGAPARIDFLSLDTEGSELEILETVDFETWDIRHIAVEHNHTDKRDLILALLTSKGYERKLKTLSDVDDFYVKRPA